MCLRKILLEGDSQQTVFVLNGVNYCVVSELPVLGKATLGDTLVGILTVVGGTAAGSYTQNVSLSCDFDIFTTPPSKGNLQVESLTVAHDDVVRGIVCCSAVLQCIETVEEGLQSNTDRVVAWIRHLIWLPKKASGKEKAGSR